MIAGYFNRLFELDPALRPLFKEDLTEQRKKLMQMIGGAVRGLSNLPALVPVVEDLGRRHVGNRVQDSHYDTVGAALLRTLKQGLGPAFTPEVNEAWATVYGVLATTMQNAAASIEQAAGPNNTERLSVKMLFDQSNPTPPNHPGEHVRLLKSKKQSPMKKPSKHPGTLGNKSGALFAAALLTSAFNFAYAGQMDANHTGSKIVIDKAPENNPLSFFGGALVFDVQERVRWEIRDNNFDFNDAVNVFTDDNWFLQRARIGMLVKPSDWFKIYVQGQDSREINSDRPDFPGLLAAEGDDAFDLRQGYFEFGNPMDFPLTLKVGRQILSYGDERLIGAFDWNNIGRTFDAVKLRWEEKTWWLDAFASTVVVPERGSYNQSDLFNGNENDRQQVFSGLYFSTTALGPQTIDLYALYLHENQNPKYLPAALGDTDFVTLGLRLKSKPGAFAHSAPAREGKMAADGKSMPPPPAAPKPVGLDYEFEGAFQTGEVRGLDLTAFAVHGGLGYTFDIGWLPRLGVAYNFGSGDGDPADGDIETFQNLFPTNHKFYGQMDVFSWQNMHEIEVSVKAQPVKAVTLKAEYRAFWLASTDDVWYRANGVTAVRPLTALARNADSYAGSEVDVVAQWTVNKHFAVEAGYSHFFAGDYLADTGASDDADFGYVQATITF